MSRRFKAVLIAALMLIPTLDTPDAAESRVIRPPQPDLERFYNDDIERLRNQANASGRLDPERSIQLWEKLLTQYPHWIDRWSGYYAAIPVAMRVRDSAYVHALIDSLVAIRPAYNVFEHIAWATAGLNTADSAAVYPGTSIRVATQAVDLLRQVPDPLRGEAEYKLQIALTHAHLLAGDLDGATRWGEAALETYAGLPHDSNLVRNRWDATPRADLGRVALLRNDPAAALEHLTLAATANPLDETIWRDTRRAYVANHGSDDGFATFRGDIEAGYSRLTPIEEPVPTNFSLLDFILPGLDGRPVSLASYEGRVLLLHFWTYTCGPCIQEMRLLDEIATRYPGQVEVASVHARFNDLGGIRDAFDASIRIASERAEARHPILIDDGRASLFRAANVRVLPSTLVVDPSGTVRRKFVGFRERDSEQQFTEAIEDLLAE